MRFGSREWFLLTPDEIRERRLRRSHEEIAGLTAYEPADEGEAAYVWAHMREEERGESRVDGFGERERLAAILTAERSFAVYHGDVLLVLAVVHRFPGGRRLLSMERTTHALERGHRFTWLRAYGPLARTLTALVGDVFFATPTDMPRALDVYRHAGAEQTGETIVVDGRNYWLMKIGRGNG